MRVLLSFAPLIAFPIVAGFYWLGLGLWAAAAAACVAAGFDVFVSRRSVKLLDVGQIVLFGLLAVVVWLFSPSWKPEYVHLIVNAGLLAIVLASIAAARPFTLQYAREQVAEPLWTSPIFIATNYRISWVWGGAFAVAVCVDLAKLFVPEVSHTTDQVISIAALVLAAKFTSWYPRHVRSLAQRGSPAST